MPLPLLNPDDFVYNAISADALAFVYPSRVLSPGFGLYPLDENPCPWLGWTTEELPLLT